MLLKKQDDMEKELDQLHNMSKGLEEKCDLQRNAFEEVYIYLNLLFIQFLIIVQNF